MDFDFSPKVKDLQKKVSQFMDDHVLDAIASVFNRFAIPRLMALNSFPDAGGTPRLVHGDVESIDIDKLGDYVVKLFQAGIDLTDEPTERFLRLSAGLPEREDDGDGIGDVEGGGSRRGPELEEPEIPEPEPEPGGQAGR